MSKKSRRVRAKRRTAAANLAKRVPIERVPIRQAPSESKASVPSVQPSLSSVQTTRYQYVLPELRRIGIIAGALLLILIVLTFILG